MIMDKYCTKKNPEIWFTLEKEEDGKVHLKDAEGATKSITSKTFRKNYKEYEPVEAKEDTSLASEPAQGLTQEEEKETQGRGQEELPVAIPDNTIVGQITENSMRANREAKAGEIKPFVPKRPYLRQSMIKQFEMDPGTFYRKYEDDHQESTIFTSTGTSVHGVMEDFFNLTKAGKYRGEDQTFEIFYHDEWMNIEAFVDRAITDWWAKYGEADYEWFGLFRNYSINYLERVVRDGIPEVIATEFEFTLEEPVLGTPVSGTIDRIDRVDERTIRIVDYKTNFMPFSGDDLNNSEQFMMYTLACSALKDQLGDFDIVICTYEMIRLGYAQHVVFEEPQLADFQVYMKMLWKKILSGTDREFRPNRFTAYSTLRDENPEYNKMLHRRITEQFDAEDVNALIEERESIEMTIKTCKVRKDELDQALKSHIAQADGELTVGDRIYSLRASAKPYFDSDKVIRQLAMNGLADQIGNMVNFSAKQLRDNVPAPIYDQIYKVAGETRYTAPQISSKKVK